MTTILDTEVDQPATLATADLPDTATEPEEPEGERRDDEELAQVSTVQLALVAISATLSALGAAWMVGGMFRGVEARLIAITGVLLGAGLSYAGTRWRANLLHYLVLPLSLLVGAGLMAPASGGGTSSLPALVKDAVTSSQVLQPPIDFAPGWRLILVVLLALVTAASSGLALSLRRTRLAVAVPVPLTLAAALVQPAGTAIATGAVSVGLVVMALATSYAADGVGDTFDSGFELRRLGRSAAAGVLLIAALLAASRVTFLFPDKQQHHVIPPRKPPVSPPQPDVPLYHVKGTLTEPLRVGVIDVYDRKQQAWLLPPVDNQRLNRLTLPANIPGQNDITGPPAQITVTIEQATGHLMPDLASTTRVDGHSTVNWDPRTQTLALADRPVYTGQTYTLSAPPEPTGAQLSAATGKVPAGMAQFLIAPPVPPIVQQLLSKAPPGKYAQLQYLRAALYKHFTAAGQGKPTDVSADRVVQLLQGGTGNPYELTASEGLLARWAGIPSRIGYGYYNGTRLSDGETEFRPDNAATYLEVWFAPYGWVPIVGVPPHAQASLSTNQQKQNPNIQAAPDLDLQVFLPTRIPPQIPLYEYVWYYAVRVLPFVAGALLLLISYPVVLKRIRRRRRSRWAAARGPAGAVAVAYCGLRDLVIDLGLPGRGTTPLELVELVAEDEEHAELAWLVTRGLWGDLRDTLTDEDAAAAVALARSVGSRIAKAQPETARLLATVSRASLRSPYSIEVPNAWWQLRLRVPRPSLSWQALRKLRPGLGTAALMLLLVVGLGGCAGPGAKAATTAPVPFPTLLAPTEIAGLTTHLETKAVAALDQGAAKDRNIIVADGKVLSFSRNGLIQAALQVSQLKPGYVTTDRQVVSAVTASLAQNGGTVQTLKPQDGRTLYGSLQGSRRIYLWFPTSQSMAFLVLRAQITQGAAEAMARALIDYGVGKPIDETALTAAFANIPGVGIAVPAGTATPVVAPPPSPSPSPTAKGRS